MQVGWNETATTIREERCVPELFAEQVARTPEAVAVSYEGEQLTYENWIGRPISWRTICELGVRPEGGGAVRAALIGDDRGVAGDHQGGGGLCAAGS